MCARACVHVCMYAQRKLNEREREPIKRGENKKEVREREEEK